MAVKAVGEIPLPVAGKRASYREMIRNDIQYAIDNGINKFEFEGDYNYKYLAQYAREEAETIWGKKIWDIFHEVREQLGIEAYAPIASRLKYKGMYIRVMSVKMEDRNHVYCEIFPDAPKKMHDKAVAEAQKKQEEKDEIAEKIANKDLSAKVRELGLTIRTRNALLRAGVNTVEDLSKMEWEQVAHIRNMGRKGEQEVRELLWRFGVEVDG